jgi:hypothetical protein
MFSGIRFFAAMNRMRNHGHEVFPDDVILFRAGNSLCSENDRPERIPRHGFQIGER